MTSRMTCEEVRELAPEVALEIISGDERARVIAHASTCPRCRALLEDLSDVSDSLLLLAPDKEPPAGFESRVLARIKEPIVRRLNLWAAAAVLAVAGATGAAVWWGTAEQRELGEHYAHALEEANGDYFGVKPLRSQDGSKSGNVFAYQGSPSWLFVVFTDSIEAGTYRVQLRTRSNKVVSLGTFQASGGSSTWGRELTMGLEQVAALSFVSERGTATFQAVFPEP